MVNNTETLRVLITGSTGFVGNGLLARLLRDDIHRPTISLRSSGCTSKNVKIFHVPDISSDTSWLEALKHIDVVVHLAARVHIMQDTVADPLSEFRRTNTAGTLNLARQSVNFGVRRFIYLSSIKVNGEDTSNRSIFTAETDYIPTDPYGLSKFEAEQGLRQIEADTGLEVVIIRPPLVYGASVRANFKIMMNWLSKGVPLPLGAIQNQRSLVALDNLVDLIVTCIDHPDAASETFLVSDDDDLSTTELLRRLAKALGRSSRLIPVPSRLLIAGLTVLGRQDIGKRLCESLQVDISHTKITLDWVPPMSVNEALQKTADDYLRQIKKNG